jgi:hypothetical protein
MISFGEWHPKFTFPKKEEENSSNTEDNSGKKKIQEQLRCSHEE